MKNEPYLHMLDVGQQSLSRGSLNASFTQIAGTGFEEATRSLFEKCIETHNQIPLAHDSLSDLDGLQPQQLTQQLLACLVNLEELSEPNLNVDELAARVHALRGLNASTMSRLQRDVVRHSSEVVNSAFNRIRSGLENAFFARPAESATFLSQTRDALGAINLPNPELKSLHRLTRLVQAVADLTARRNALAKSTFEDVLPAVLGKARELFGESLTALAQKLIADKLRQGLADMEAFLDELARRAGTLDERLDVIRKTLAERQKRAAERHKVSQASVILPLPGPDKNQVLTGMMDRAHCGDLRQFAAWFLERFAGQLRQFARAHCPGVDADLAPLIKLILSIDSVQAAELFAEVAEASIGEGHSLYEIIELFGVAECAYQLHRRAKPTCHLAERNREQFNVPTAQLTIVRFPRTIGPRDREIRDRLQAAFEKLGECIFSDEIGAEAVTVVRLEIGWPIGIEQANAGLLKRYLDSHRHGHLPHVLGILDDSPLGAVSERYRATFPQGV